VPAGPTADRRPAVDGHCEQPLSDRLRFDPLTSGLAALDPRSTPGRPGGEARTTAALAALAPELAQYQDRLYAEGTRGGRRRLLLVLQGMDTAGKDGTIRRVVGPMSPQGVSVASFKEPTAAERRHDFLWRIRRRVPAPGVVGVFNRSHYEDVLIVRVHALVPEDVWRGRYEQINDFERGLVDDGVGIVKVFLNVSGTEQRRRLLARLDDPDKYWKYSPHDVDERAFWADYQVAYGEALERCSTPEVPWYVVPADHKWYRNWAVAQLVMEALREMTPQYPPADFDVRDERERLAAS
jgi:PPK2 family polyphosphate:nucleotide phosphotransferase